MLFALGPPRPNTRRYMEQTIQCGKHLIQHAKLTGSRFHDVCLGSAEFQNVSLAAANFENVNLSNARLNNINMSGVEITDVDTSGMKINGILVDEMVRGYQTEKTNHGMQPMGASRSGQ